MRRPTLARGQQPARPASPSIEQVDLEHALYAQPRDIQKLRMKRAFVDEKRPSASLVDRYTTSRPSMADAFGSTPETRHAFERLAQFDQLRDVPVSDQPLPNFFAQNGNWSVVMGAYLPFENAILMGPQSVVGDARDVYTMAEETAHSLLHSLPCDIYSPEPGTAYEDLPEEREAKTAAMAAVLQAGVPFTDAVGRTVDPNEVRFDVEQAEQDMKPEMLTRVKWASGLLADAMMGDVAGAAAQSHACPR